MIIKKSKFLLTLILLSSLSLSSQVKIKLSIEDCLATWAAEQTANSQWITIEKAIEEYAIESDVLLSVTACKQIRIKCKDAKVLVNVMDVKQLKELKQWVE